MMNLLFKKIVHAICGHKLYNQLRLGKVYIDFKLGRQYELLNFLPNLVKSGDHCFDIGANIGEYALNLSKLVGGGHVYSFEPIEENFYLLTAMVRRRKLGNVSIFKMAISNYNGKEKLFIPKISGLKMATRAFLKSSNVSWKDKKDEVEEVNVRTIDSLMDILEIKRISFHTFCIKEN